MKPWVEYLTEHKIKKAKTILSEATKKVESAMAQKELEKIEQKMSKFTGKVYADAKNTINMVAKHAKNVNQDLRLFEEMLDEIASNLLEKKSDHEIYHMDQLKKTITNKL